MKVHVVFDFTTAKKSVPEEVQLAIRSSQLTIQPSRDVVPNWISSCNIISDSTESVMAYPNLSPKSNERYQIPNCGICAR